MRGWLVIGIVLATLAAPFPALARGGEWGGVAFAAKAHAEGEAAGEGHRPGEVAEGLFKGALDLAIWTVVVFLVLLFVLGKFAWKPLVEGLDRREQSIHSAMKEAQAARDEATRLRQELQGEMNKAHETIRTMMDEARRHAEAAAAEVVAKGKADLQAERERAHRELEVSTDQALQRIWTQGVQLATLISAKAVGRHLGEDDHRRLLEEALAEFRQAGQERRKEDSVRA
jgi:F-type H+-transporting ATPase subunit b